MKPLRTVLRFPVVSAPDELEPAIETFHRFIQRGLVEGFVLDVADYRHVPDGPGVLLVGHDIDYGVSHDAFTAVRKRCAELDVATQTRDLLRMALGALAANEYVGRLDLEVDTSRFTVEVIDRRLTDDEQTAKNLQAALEPLVAEVYGDDATITVVERDDPRDAPAVSVAASASVAAHALEKLGGAHAPMQSPWDITVEELARLREAGTDFVLLDVREENEHEIVNIGGKLAPPAELGDRVAGIDRDAKIVAHCRSGTRAAEAVRELRDAGYGDAWNVNGGLMAWIDRIDPSLPSY